MTKADEAPHLRSFFRQSKNDWTRTSELLERLRGIAISEIGEQPGWELDSRNGSNGTVAFLMAARRQNKASLTSAALVLDTTMAALEQGALSEQAQNWLIDAWAGMESAHVVAGKQLIDGQKKGRDAQQAVANEKHDNWQKMANELFRTNPSLSKAAAAQIIGRKVNEPEGTIRNNIEKPINLHD